MKNSKKNNDGDPILTQKKPWDTNANSIWLASTISLLRNIEKFKFPAKLEKERQKQLIALTSKQLLNGAFLSSPKLFHAEELNPLQKQFLGEHFLSPQNFQQAHSGEAFVIDDNGDFLATLNIHDHLHLHILDCKGELEAAWAKLVQLETNLGKALTFAYSPKYGFLTSDLSQCGTGLLISVFLQVPALIHTGKIDAILDKLMDDSLTVTGLQGNPTEIIGDILVVQNNYTLAISEDSILSNLRAFTTKMVVEENSVRGKIAQENNAEIKDRISRAFGILIHSYQIEAVEALNAISLLKLGLELGWLKGITIQDINNLFFTARRAHLIQQYGGTIKQEEMLHKRTEYIHEALKKAQLTI